MSSPPRSNGAVPPAWRFLVDENLPEQLADRLTLAGHFAEHVRDVGLGREDDPILFDYAQAHDESIISIDSDFGDIRKYPPPHAGLVVVELPNSVPIQTRLDIILDGLGSLAGQPLADLLVIIETKRVRVRRP